MIGFCLNTSSDTYHPHIHWIMFRLRDPTTSVSTRTEHGSSSDTDSSENENILLNIVESDTTGGAGNGELVGESARTGKNIYNDDDIIRVDDDRYIFNPYNTENIEVSLADIENILIRYGVPSQVHNIELYKRAFILRTGTPIFSDWFSSSFPQSVSK